MSEKHPKNSRESVICSIAAERYREQVNGWMELCILCKENGLAHENAMFWQSQRAWVRLQYFEALCHGEADWLAKAGPK